MNRSFQELTPVEFACETMENVAKELYELIDQYRADSKRNINPFSMRLQGIIDANVMGEFLCCCFLRFDLILLQNFHFSSSARFFQSFAGGISKYQEAFFTDEFRQSVEGKSQQVTVQRLKQLMLKQVQILETALQLHGNLAPDGVQPLHKRLLERFLQMKQSINGMDKMRRQFSESIVNTPLPPLPVEKRSQSIGQQPRPAAEDLIDDHSNYHMMNFEKEEIYTRPSRLNGNTEMAKTPQQHPPIQRCISGRDHNLLARADSGGNSITAPPIPIRPKSAGYGNYDSPEIPPKLSMSKDFVFNAAPPLPPRGVTPDKRVSNPMLNTLNYCTIDYQENDLHSASMIKSPHQKYSVVNIPLEDRIEADIDQFKFEQNGGGGSASQVEFRDSGISTTSHDLNYAYIYSDGVRTIATSSSQHGSNFRLHSESNTNDSNENGENDSNGSGGGHAHNDNVEADNPPPIPRKMTNSISYGMNHSTSTDSFRNDIMDQAPTRNGSGGSAGNGNGADGETAKMDDYCMPKISNNH